MVFVCLSFSWCHRVGWAANQNQNQWQNITGTSPSHSFRRKFLLDLTSGACSTNKHALYNDTEYRLLIGGTYSATPPKSFIRVIALHISKSTPEMPRSRESNWLFWALAPQWIIDLLTKYHHHMWLAASKILDWQSGWAADLTSHPEGISPGSSSSYLADRQMEVQTRTVVWYKYTGVQFTVLAVSMSLFSATVTLVLSHRTLIPGAFLILIMGWALSRVLFPTRKLPYPPGPPEKSMVSGNLNDLPTTFAWRTYTEWGKKYGNVGYRWNLI